MPSNLAEWDAKHRAAAGNGPAEPAGIVCELLPLLPHGPALDLACGAGRHTLLLAKRSQPVTAVDGSPAALDSLAQQARAENLAVRREGDQKIVAETRDRHIRLVQADLERAILPSESFSLILCVHYLQRRDARLRDLHPGADGVRAGAAQSCLLAENWRIAHRFSVSRSCVLSRAACRAGNCYSRCAKTLQYKMNSPSSMGGTISLAAVCNLIVATVF
jgi:SAM-dependent methyltransferase